MRPGRREWTKDDDSLLLKLVRRRTAPERIAELLNRTVRAVYNRMHRRQLTDPRWMNRVPKASEEFMRRNKRRLCAVPVLTGN